MSEAFQMFLGICLQSVVVIVTLLTCFAYMTWWERRTVAWMQWRVGPNRVGWQGLFQPLADGGKLLFKEQLQPRDARPFLFGLAPCISLVVALSAYAVIPVHSGPITIPFLNWTVHPSIADPGIGVLYLLGISSLGVYGIILGGWSSNNKYAMIGAIRSSAQVISYELALGTALISPLLLIGSLSFRDIVGYQAQGPFWGEGGWLVFAQPLAFVLYCIAAVAEVNRAPFDLPEAEQELGAGYHTEYSGMKFAMFFMAEYVNMITVSSVAATVFLGGPNSPVPALIPAGIWWFFLKVASFMFCFIWLRATFPRFRYDQLMRIGWQMLLPLGLLNLAVSALGVVLKWKSYQFFLAVSGMILMLVMLSVLNRPQPRPGHQAHH